MAVQARHKITGLIGSVSEGDFANNPNLEKVSEEEIAEAKRVRYLKVFGYLPDEKPAPPVPGMDWSKERLIALAQSKKIEVDDSITKRELVKALTEGDK
jgi:hypothetical protein